MPSVFVKVVRSPDRHKVTISDFSQTIDELKKKVAEEMGIPLHQQRMVYWGQILSGEKALESYGLKNNSTIYIIQVEEEPTPSDVPVSKEEEISSGKLSTVLETAINNPLYKHSVRKILQDSEALEQIIAATPGLREDHVAMTLLKDPELLLQVSDTANVERIVQDHPALAQAASHIIAAITEDTTATRQLLQDRRNLGTDSDDDLQEFEPELIARAEMMAAAEEQRHDNQTDGGARESRITHAHLASALTQAGYRPASSSNDPGPSSRSRQNIITSELFSQALASAISSTSSPASTSGSASATLNTSAASVTLSPQAPAAPTSNLNAEALQQIRDMGIEDDELSARALEVSGGDVQTALNLIFEGGLD